MKLLPTLTLISILLVIAWNYAVNALPLNGITSGEVSALYPTLITPAGYAFSIWGLIYIGLLAFGIFQLLPAAQNASTLALENRDAIRKFLIINMIGNALWLLAFHYQYIGISVLVMLGILTSLILINLRLTEAAFPVWVNWSFHIYFGWITVAAVVNVSVQFYDWNILNHSSLAWLVSILLLAFAIGFSIMWVFKAYAYLSVLIWAFMAIGAKLSTDFPNTNYAYWPWALAALMVGGIVIRLFRP